jgi:hypothetical protein
LSPRVIPNLQQDFVRYSIFDWLHLYGVNYLSGTNPSKSDFPIKLAGYMNRIRELNSRLHCRLCEKMMIPNMKYARVEIVKIDSSTGSKIKIPFNAAYRLTVFKCNNEDCLDYGAEHYINHCMGFKCYELIDSRDLKEKCSEGRYICPNPKCQSCCPTHAKETPSVQKVNSGEKHRNLYK